MNTKQVAEYFRYMAQLEYLENGMPKSLGDFLRNGKRFCYTKQFMEERKGIILKLLKI